MNAVGEDCEGSGIISLVRGYATGLSLEPRSLKFGLAPVQRDADSAEGAFLVEPWKTLGVRFGAPASRAPTLFIAGVAVRAGW